MHKKFNDNGSRTRSLGCINNKETTMKNLINVMATFLVALTVLVPAFAQAQDTDTSATDTDGGVDTDSDSQNAPFKPTGIFANANYLYGEDGGFLAYNAWFYSQGTVYSEKQARDAVKGMILRNIRNAEDQQKMADSIDGMFDMLVLLFKPAAPEEFTEMQKNWEAHLTSLGCNLGAPDSEGCKKVFDVVRAIAEELVKIGKKKCPERAKVAEGFLGPMTDIYRENLEIDQKNDYPNMTLMAHGAIYVLSKSIWEPLNLDSNGMPGTEVGFDSLDDKHGLGLWVTCSDKGYASCTVSGKTDKSKLVCTKDAVEYTFLANDVSYCRFFLLDSKVPDWQLAKAAKDGDALINGREIMKGCPTDMDEIVGREAAVYRDGAKTVYGIISAKTDNGFIVGEGKGALTITCAELTNGTVIVALGPKTGEGGGNTTIGMFGIGLFGGWAAGLGSNANDTGFTMFGGEFVFRPLSKLGFSLDLHLKIGAIYATGVAPYASDVPGVKDKFSFLGGVGLGGSYIWKLLEISIKGDFLFTGEGGIGGGGELRIGMAWEHFAWYVGVMAGYLKTGISAGDNPDVLSERKFDSINSGYVGPTGGIEVRF